MSRLTKSFFDRDCDLVARDLLGVRLFVNGTGGPIVETECYDADDPASHSYLMRQTERNAAMFGPAARAYIYLSYGIHWCLNFVCQRGSAVLIRAIMPERGLELMMERRGGGATSQICSGPGKLCQALDITGALNHKPILKPPFSLEAGRADLSVASGPRIGISKARNLHRRYGVKGSPYLSRPF